MKLDRRLSGFKLRLRTEEAFWTGGGSGSGSMLGSSSSDWSPFTLQPYQLSLPRDPCGQSVSDLLDREGESDWLRRGAWWLWSSGLRGSGLWGWMLEGLGVNKGLHGRRLSHKPARRGLPASNRWKPRGYRRSPWSWKVTWSAGNPLPSKLTEQQRRAKHMNLGSVNEY